MITCTERHHPQRLCAQQTRREVALVVCGGAVVHARLVWITGVLGMDKPVLLVWFVRPTTTTTTTAPAPAPATTPARTTPSSTASTASTSSTGPARIRLEFDRGRIHMSTTTTIHALMSAE